MTKELNQRHQQPVFPEPLTVEAIFRNSRREIIVRWIDKNGEIRVIETCPPTQTAYYGPNRKF